MKELPLYSTNDIDPENPFNVKEFKNNNNNGNNNNNNNQNNSDSDSDILNQQMTEDEMDDEQLDLYVNEILGGMADMEEITGPQSLKTIIIYEEKNSSNSSS